MPRGSRPACISRASKRLWLRWPPCTWGSRYFAAGVPLPATLRNHTRARCLALVAGSTRRLLSVKRVGRSNTRCISATAASRAFRAVRVSAGIRALLSSGFPRHYICFVAAPSAVEITPRRGGGCSRS